MNEQEFRPTGGMDTDTDPRYLEQGEYIRAFNIDDKVDKSGITRSKIPYIGNTYAFVPDPATEQNEIFRIYLSTQVSTANSSISFLTINSATVFNATIVFNTDIATTVADAVTNISAQLTGAGYTFNITPTVVDTVNGYIDLEITGVTGTLITGWSYIGLLLSPGIVTNIILVQESVDTSMIGEWHNIGSYDMLGDLFSWWTTRNQDPLQLFVFSVADNGSGLIRVTSASPHLMGDGFEVKITGVQGVPANGTWIVDVISPTVFDLLGSTFSGAYTGGGVILTAPQGLSEIGESNKNLSTGAWTYIRLLRTKRFNFSTLHQIDVDAEPNTARKSFYFNDYFNSDRVFYYTGAYVQDGAISTINPSGFYTYSTVERETRLFVDTDDINLQWTSQAQGGGSLTSGNWRYAIQGITDSGTGGTYTYLTNPVPVFRANTSSPEFIQGDPPGTITGKINTLTVSGTSLTQFKFITLIGVNYVGSAIVGFVIKKVLIPENITTLTIDHSGNEGTTEDLDLGTINFLNTVFDISRNMRCINNHLVRSRLKKSGDYNLSDFALTLTHAIKLKVLKALGDPVMIPPGIQQVDAEYQALGNVNNFMGYMWNENYRFVIKAHKKNGGYSDWFLVQDITFNTDGAFPRRTFAPANMDLTNGGAGLDITEVYAPYVEFTIPDVHFILDDNKRFSEVFDHIIIGRAECIPEVLSSGMAVIGISVGEIAGTLEWAYLDDDSNPFSLPPRRNGEYPWISGRTGAPFATDPLYPSTFTPERRTASLYLPDPMWRNQGMSFISGDVLLNFGNPDSINGFDNQPSTQLPNADDFYGSYTGVTGTAVPVSIPLLEVKNMGGGGDVTTLNAGAIIYSKRLYLLSLAGTVGIDARWFNEKGQAVRTSADLLTTTGFNDYGFYMVQYFRAKVNKYGNLQDTKYFTTNAKVSFTDISGASQIVSVFGGDTFTQRVQLEHRYAVPGAFIAPQTTGVSGGVLFYCQNRVNVQLNYSGVNPSNTFPTVTFPFWLDNIGNHFEYNEGYTIRNGVNEERGFDSTAIVLDEAPVTINYSDDKPQEALNDTYRINRPLNIKNLDLTLGYITHHEILNGNLFCLQQRGWNQLFFNSSNILSFKDNSQVVIGDAGILDRTQNLVSRIGCRNKWSFVKSRSKGGNDVGNWIDSELGIAARFGYDGTVNIIDVKGLHKDFQKAVQWVRDHDTPAFGLGICGVWDDGKRRVIWTVRGTRQADLFNKFATYSQGDIVITEDNATFEGIPYIYVSLVNGNLGHDPAISTNFWLKPPIDDNDYYNLYTIVFDEYKSKFPTYLSPKPKIYLKWTNTYLSPRPIFPESLVYEHNVGNPMEWYEFRGESQSEDGYIDYCVNEFPSDQKKFCNVLSSSTVVPKRMEFITQKQVSYLNDTDFLPRSDGFYSQVKNDTTGGGLNDDDTTALRGRYMISRFVFEKGQSQELWSIITKFRIPPRLNTK